MRQSTISKPPLIAIIRAANLFLARLYRRSKTNVEEFSRVADEETTFS